ncbi:MAG: acetyl-CoA C-acetyltransferase [Acidobacteriia bacterium]|nr:acetyl-CoA C-acetyltransferase [Terriglobia bacterium]
MEKAVIVSGTRTAIGSFGGTLKDISAVDLAARVIECAVQRARIEKAEVEDVIFGNVLQAGQGMNPARQASVRAGIPTSVPAFTVNHVCGSGLRSVVLAAQAIAAGDAEILVAGGTEAMSQAPFVLKGARWGYRLGHADLVDAMIADGLSCALSDGIHMGLTAENIVEQYKISREDQDRFALESQQRAEAAIKGGRFKEEITAYPVPQKKGDPLAFAQDEFPRFGSTYEALAKLRSAFKKDGTVTAGNASGINDGAAALVVMSESRARAKNLDPLARIRAYAIAAVEPRVMGLGPIPAIRKVLQKAALNLDDIELIELNEAFAAQSLAVIRELGLDPAKTNVNGGAIALGHPIGASGARILVTLLYEMRRRNLHRGLAALCIGGGQGIAMVVER